MKVKLAVLVALIGFVMAGCGGSDFLNPYTGTYTGTWVSSPAGRSGNVSMVVLPTDSVSGTITESSSGAITGTLQGTLDSFGTFTGTYTDGSSVTRNMSGTFSGTSSGMVGSVTINIASGSLATTFTLTK